MDWYLPITILPASGLLIMSTTTQMLGLSNEIGAMLAVKCTPFQHRVADLKIQQLGRLTKAATSLYLSAACFVLSGLLNVFFAKEPFHSVSQYILTLGVLLVFVALVFLVMYSYKTISIRKLQHAHNHTQE